MIVKKVVLKSILYVILVIVLGINLIGCSPGKAYTFFAFTYPPSTKPHENGWNYIGKIVVYSDKPGSYFNISEKTVYFSIKDEKKNNFLQEKLVFSDCGGIDHKTTWDAFKEVNIILYEEIVKGEKLNENGVKVLDIKKFPLCKLKFEYNAKDKRFHLTQKEDLGGRKKGVKKKGTATFILDKSKEKGDSDLFFLTKVNQKIKIRECQDKEE